MSSEFALSRMLNAIRGFGFAHHVGVRYLVEASFGELARCLGSAEREHNRRSPKDQVQVSRPRRGAGARYLSLGSNAIRALSGRKGFTRLLITPARRIAGQPERVYVVIKGIEDWGSLLAWLLALCGSTADHAVVNVPYLEVAACAVLPPGHALRRQEPVRDENGKTVLVSKNLGTLTVPGSRLKVPAILTVYRIETDPPGVVKVEIATQIWKGRDEAPQDWFGDIEHDPDTYLARRDALVLALAKHLARLGLQPTERPPTRGSLPLYPEDSLNARAMRSNDPVRAIGSDEPDVPMSPALRAIVSRILGGQGEVEANPGRSKPRGRGARGATWSWSRKSGADPASPVTKLGAVDVLELLRTKRREDQGAGRFEDVETPSGPRIVITPWEPDKLFTRAPRRRDRRLEPALA